jgi:hypothetical protein
MHAARAEFRAPNLYVAHVSPSREEEKYVN